MSTGENIRLSVIVPVYNRPGEVRELLESLSGQTYKNFEVVIVEDGSAEPCEEIVKKFQNILDIKYYYQENAGSSSARNYGARKAWGNYLVFFDSDCLIPEHYTEVIRQTLEQNYTPFFGGPDTSHPSFSTLQKAIDYAMTSFLTTGGIRGSKYGRKKTFYPRSCNMGIEKQLFEKVEGFNEHLRYGEDVDLGLRLRNSGIKAVLYPKAYVYHKRRSTLKQFFKQVFRFGKARIRLASLHARSLKPIHALPTIFTVFVVFCFISAFFISPLCLLPPAFFSVLVFFGALLKYKNLKVASWAVLTTFTQLSGYGTGFIAGLIRKNISEEQSTKTVPHST